MNQKSAYREQIDACRPGTGDLALPALADLARAVIPPAGCAVETDRAVADELARSQRFDRAVSAAMHDVPVPAGLLERLEARLAAGDVADDSESTGEVALPPANARFSRRIVLTGIGLTTAAAILLAVASQFWSPPSQRISQDQLAADVSLWIGESPLKGTAWKPATQPVPGVLTITPKNPRQRSFVTANGERAVVFDVTPNRRQQVLLFVVPTPHTYLVPSAPARLRGVSGGMAVAAWQKNGTLYVLAVREVGQKLENYIHQQRLAERSARIPAARPA